MLTIERTAFDAHARTGLFRRRVEQALAIVDEMLRHSRQAYVAVSGGKDSTVMLDLVRTVRPGAPTVDSPGIADLDTAARRSMLAIHGDEEYLLPETDAYLRRVPNLRRFARTLQHASFFTSYASGKPDDLPEGVEWVEGSISRDWAPAHGFDGVFVGLRADENGYRRVHIKSRGTCFFSQSRGLWQCYPLAWWSDLDVWGYIVSRGIDYNAAYDRLAEIGVPLKRRRIGPFANERALGHGQIAILRRGWPDEFERFALRHPEARQYA